VMEHVHTRFTGNGENAHEEAPVLIHPSSALHYCIWIAVEGPRPFGWRRASGIHSLAVKAHCPWLAIGPIAAGIPVAASSTSKPVWQLAKLARGRIQP
jgi:hypothetical protein